jgi:putative transposase
MVEDVASRVCWAARVGRNLSKERAAPALQAGDHLLRHGGITASVVVQSAGGSDCTSASFQPRGQARGQWVRCRVNQAGGRGILERLNRTFNYAFVCRQEVTTSVELRELVPRFRDGYNQERLHRTLGYPTPWRRLLADVAALT